MPKPRRRRRRRWFNRSGTGTMALTICTENEAALGKTICHLGNCPAGRNPDFVVGNGVRITMTIASIIYSGGKKSTLNALTSPGLRHRSRPCRKNQLCVACYGLNFCDTRIFLGIRPTMAEQIKISRVFCYQPLFKTLHTFFLSSLNRLSRMGSIKQFSRSTLKRFGSAQ